jgi:hypothetical protein
MIVFRRGLLLLALAAVTVCVILLLNFTAPNPSGRRYSSVVVTTTEDTQAIGLSGEDTLSNDLRLPNNNDPDQRQCMCSSSYTVLTARCNLCFVSDSQFITRTHRVPDFVAPNFIAESKNRQHLLTMHTNQREQLSDYALAARLLNRPLWLYVRVNTQVDAAFTQIVESTGGGVVYYFAVPGYVDPVDRAAQTGLLLGTPLLVLTTVWEIRRRSKTRIVLIPVQPGPKNDPLRKANDAADFAQRTKDNAQRRIDIDDEQIDL